MKILTAMDGTKHSWSTLDKAIAYSKALDAELTVIGIVENEPLFITSAPYNSIVENYKESMVKVATDVLENAKKYCSEKGVKVETKLEYGAPAEVICSTADDGGFDLLVVGHSGAGRLEEFFLGSISNKIAHCVKTNVLIVK